MALRRKKADEPMDMGEEAPEAVQPSNEAPVKSDPLEEMSVQELVALIQRATELKDKKIGAAREAFLRRTREEAASLGLSLEDLVPKQEAAPRTRRATGERRPAVVKFQGPNGETWTGRGRQPTWMTALEAQGHKREEYLVDKALPGLEAAA